MNNIASRLLFLIGVTLISCSCVGTVGSTSCTILGFNQQTTGAEVGLVTYSFGGTDVAQSFQIASSVAAPTPVPSPIANISVKLFVKGSFASTDQHSVILRLETDDSGSPSGELVAGSNQVKIPVASITARTAGYYAFAFGQSVKINTNTTYWIRVGADYPSNSSDTNLIEWAGTDTGSPGFVGKALYESGSGNFISTAIGGIRILDFSLGC